MLLVIQCIVCCVVFTLIILPAQYKDKLFHVRGAGIGCVLGLIVAGLSACIVHLALL